ncbi:MAG: hypothetical protein ACRD0U_01610, partial [Acidimicrobiales bacterium]
LAVVALVVVSVVVPVTSASAQTSKAGYSWHVADDFLEQAVGSPPWAIASAPNGDWIQIDGTGVMDVAAKTASGEGRFIHNFAGGGSASGTFTAERLLSFQFYGCGGEGLPDFLCGGLAKLEVTLTPDFDPSVHSPGILWIDCVLGEDIPSGGEPARGEGIRLNVRGINFNHTEHSGFTVFVAE